MTARRAARGTPPAAETITVDLAAGPCVEDWAEPQGATARPPSNTARRNWGEAITQWAEASGIDPNDARDSARVTVPWSRDYLRATERADWADYFDGLRPMPQGDMGAPLGPPWPGIAHLAADTCTTCGEAMPARPVWTTYCSRACADA